MCAIPAHCPTIEHHLSAPVRRLVEPMRREMRNKTSGVYELVQEALGTLPQPHGEDIIEDLFLAIEKSPRRRRTYDRLVAELPKDIANNWIGKYTKRLSGLRRGRMVTARRSTIVARYSKIAP
jgi:hypothetical protein